MFFIFNILFLILIAFISGLFCARQAKFSSSWFQGIYIPFVVLIIICWMFQAPWFWVIIQFILQVLALVFAIRYQTKRLTQESIECMEQIPDLQLSRKLPANLKDEDIVVVLMNMGGPINIAEVEPFLRRLFNDPLILRFPFAQSFFADLLIRSRLKAVQARYQLMGGGSPILASSLKQVSALAQELEKRGRKISVLLSFNYTVPLPIETIDEIKKMKKRHILPVGLYSHFSNSTTASNIFYLKKEAKKNYPQLQFLESYSYHLHEGYIQAFVDRIQEALKPGENLDDFYVLFSAHGTPLYFLNEGDPYAFLVSQTVSRILGVLNRKYNWSISYQSSVGPLLWLKPSTDAMLAALGSRGIRKMIIVPISFVTDHIETICEIDIEYREVAHKEGIEDFRMTKAVECHPGFINALADCVESSLSK